MPAPTRDQAKAELATLIENHRSLERPDLQSEANVRSNFLDPLFAALGWPINDPIHYNREEHVRGAGFADIALKSDPTADSPLIYVEAKRFGMIEPLNRVQDRRNSEVSQLRLQLPGMSVDRTREEQQAINYAYQKGMRWAILTNFERFRLFNARRDTLVLSFDSPQDLLIRFDELWQLAFSEVKLGSLESLRGHRERLDIDEEYLRLINVWRLRLGQDIVSHRENRILLEDQQTGKIDVHKLRDAVQRILDRLVVIRHAEDRLVIRVDQLRSIVEIRERSDYGVPLLDQIRYFFQEFNVRHNGSLFAEHLCDRMTVSEDVLHALIINLYDARFRSMSADIMGNTYEQYLGQTLAVSNGDVATVDNLETRKAQGSYYTPEYIVQYIVDQTLGKYLYGTENGRPDGTPIPGQQRKRLEDIDGSNGQPRLTILDAACGSGSFLMNVYHVLEAFYEAEIKRITAEREQKYAEVVSQNLSPLDLQIALSAYKVRLDGLHDFRNQILERHLYGVDLDPQAAELAAVNLMLRAMTRDIRLPLILNQNIKVGNSLLGGLGVRQETTAESLAPFAEQLQELRRLRLAQQGIAQDRRHPLELQGQFERLAHEVNTALNEGLSAYFNGDVAGKRPFNWIVEFPEIFLNEQGQLRPDSGFTFVLGNPPYLSVDDTWGNNSPDAAYLKQAFADIWNRKSDAYYYFIRRGLSLLQPNGQLGFITARYYLEAYYAQNLRQTILQEANLRQIIDFGDYTVFPRVGTKTCITLLQRQDDNQSRTTNSLLCDKAAHKQIDVRHFLSQFQHTAHSFPQADLDTDSWNLYGQAISDIIAKIDSDTVPLGDLSYIDTGMETGRNDIFGVSQEIIDRYQIEPELIRKNIKNQDIKRYNLAFRGLYLIYTEEIENLDAYPYTKVYLEEHRAILEKRASFQRGGCEWWQFTWPRQKDLYSLPKIVNPNIAPENRFALDSLGEYIGLTDTYAIFPTDNSPDLRYLLAILNSKVLNFRFRYIGKAKDYRYEYFKNGLKKIPIKLSSSEIEEELIELAQKMLDMNFLRQVLYDEFQDMLTATIHTTRDFYGAYYDHSEYRHISIRRVGTADANRRATITHIAAHEADTQLILRVTTEEGDEFRLLSLDVPDPLLRHFLLLAIRAHLITNERKQIWSRGRALSGTLRAFTVPVLDEITAVTNIEKIHQLMSELEQRVATMMNDKMGERPLPTNDLLNLSVLERHLSQTDNKINELVFTLYGITDSADRELIRDILS